LDEREYAVAKTLDPKDPTPWFYDAIAKQTTNRPVEALHDLEKAIELNQDRAVYRSRLLLDSDLAARNASLGRIYSDLGFQPLALVEGWKSVSTDPSNFSAHRFLADSYAVLPRHEIARVSELLQSQLLQPLNMTHIQPRVTESNLFLVSAQGPTALSFNEFNPIFNRDRVTLQMNSLVGENSTYAGEGILSGLYHNIAFSLGGFRFSTDGFRENAEQRDEIANAFVQWELSPQSSLQAEYRHRNIERGDLQQRFFPQDFFSDLTDELESSTIRLGGRYSFSPESVLLGSVIYQDVDFRLTNKDFPDPGDFYEFKTPENAVSAELQHLSRSPYLNLRAGAGYFNRDSKRNTTLVFPEPDPIESRSVTDRDRKRLNAYAYANVNPLKNLTTTLGLSFDSVNSDEDIDKHQLNPKLGITWTPLMGTTFRAALFRTLKRTLINDQTLEPTEVAGFNQFFDDADLTEAWRYGGAIDQKLTEDLFMGLEGSKRDLSVPFLFVPENSASLVRSKVNWDEYLGRAYIFWTPHPRLALSTDYRFERFRRPDRFEAGVRELDTQRVLVGMNWFHPSGLSGTITPTYWHQDGTFEGFTDDDAHSGRANFWTVDAAVGYRLPKRYGFISVGATNLLDEEFKFFDSDVENSLIQPVRTFFLRLTLAFP
jgi:opacity protein-like surface antigen